MPVFWETLPVRADSGHFAGFSGRGHREKSAERSQPALLLELYSILILFSGGKTAVPEGKPCRFYGNHAGRPLSWGKRSPLRARITVSLP